MASIGYTYKYLPGTKIFQRFKYTEVLNSYVHFKYASAEHFAFSIFATNLQHRKECTGIRSRGIMTEYETSTFQFYNFVL